jgi:hypothetical protein
MSNTYPGKDPDATRAKHGARSEVTWRDGVGREPYANQGPADDGEPAAAGEFSEGDRGELSGRNLEQLEQVRKKP